MTNRFKFFGSNHPNSVPNHILERRVEQIDFSDQKNKTTKFLLGAGALAAAGVAVGLSAIHYNRAHPVSRSTPIEQSGGFMNSGLNNKGQPVVFREHKPSGSEKQ